MDAKQFKREIRKALSDVYNPDFHISEMVEDIEKPRYMIAAIRAVLHDHARLCVEENRAAKQKLENQQKTAVADLVVPKWFKVTVMQNIDGIPSKYAVAYRGHRFGIIMQMRWNPAMYGALYCDEPRREYLPSVQEALNYLVQKRTGTSTGD